MAEDVDDRAVEQPAGTQTPAGTSPADGTPPDGTAGGKSSAALALDERAYTLEELSALAGRLDEASARAMLSDGRPVVRGNSVRALAVLGVPDAGMVPMLRDGDESVAEAAADSLAHLGRRVSAWIPAMAQAVDQACEPARARVLETFAAMVGTADDAFVEALDSAPEQVSDAAVEALVRAGRPGVDLLTRALTLEKTLVRYNSARAVSRLAEAGVFGAIGVDQKIVTTLSHVRDTDDATDVRTAAAGAISAVIAVAHALALRAAQRQAAEAADVGIPGFAEGAMAADELRERGANAVRVRLVLALRDGREHVRQNAIYALAGGVGTDVDERRAVASQISILLRDPAAPVRQAAATALGWLGAHAAPVAHALVEVLGDGDPDVVHAAAFTLRELGPDARDALVHPGLATASPVHAARVLECLAALDDAEDILCRAFSSPAVSVQVNAATGLGRLGRDRVGPAARRLLETARTGGDAATRDAVHQALATLAPPDPEGPPAIEIPGFHERVLESATLESAEALDRASLLAALSDPRPYARANAGRFLAVRADDMPAAELARVLTVLIRDGEAVVRAATADALGRLAAHASQDVDRVRDIAATLAQRLGDDDPSVIDAARDSLVQLGDAALPGLAVALETDDPDTVDRILDIAIRSTQAPERLAAWFTDGSDNLRVNAARGMGLLGRERVGPGLALLEAARTGFDTRTRAAVQRALDLLAPPAPDAPPAIEIPGFYEQILAPETLAGAGDSASMDSVLAAASDGRPPARANAATLLGGRGALPSEHASTMAVLLRDSAPSVRLATAHALERLPGAALEIADALVSALGDARSEVADAAARALGALEKDAAPALIRGLDSDEEARIARLLPLIAQLDGASQLLFQAYQTPALNVQVNAADGLARLDRKAVSEDILDTLDDEQWFGDLRKRRAVRRALKALR